MGPQPTAADTSVLSLVVVAGPTGVGKTQVALELARQLDGELIGADSVQVYRGFDIGSSKPGPAELAGIAHHLIDVREPEQVLDAAGYAALADEAIRAVSARGRLPIVVGGTGLWLRALLRGLVPVPAVDPALRARLEADWDLQGGLAAHARLAEVDPISAARIHPNDKLRVVRALEVFEQTGQPLGAARSEHARGSARYRDRTFVIDLEPALFRERVHARTQAMLQAGFRAEVERLLAKHGPHVRALQAVGYRQMLEHLQQASPEADLARAIERATLLYARRQRTWWKSEPGVHAHLRPRALLEPDQLRALEAFKSS
jgi:tRNA dimethylallyltransferase